MYNHEAESILEALNVSEEALRKCAKEVKSIVILDSGNTKVSQDVEDIITFLAENNSTEYLRAMIHSLLTATKSMKEAGLLIAQMLGKE